MQLHKNPSTSKRLIKNTIFNAMGRLWGVIAAIVLTPYIVGHIGLERYGIWAIVGVLTGYFGLLDFGISASFVKYIAEFYTKKEDGNINCLVVTGFTFYSLFTVLLIFAAWCSAPLILDFIKIPTLLYNEAYDVFLIGVAVFGFSNALGVFSAIQPGLQRMDISNKVTIVLSVFNIAGTIFVMERGYSLIGLMINNACILCLSAAVNIVLAFRLLPSLRIVPRFFNLGMLRRLFDFGYKIQIAKLEGMVIFQTDKIIIAHFLNMGIVSLYQLGNAVIMQARELPLLLNTAVIPTASELNAKQDRERLCELYLRGTKYLALIGLPLLSYVLINAHLIMFTWMGLGYEKSALVIQIFAPCYMINILTGVGSQLAFGMGRPDFHAKVALVQFPINLALSIFLVTKIGFIGVVVATLIAVSLSSIWFMSMLHRYLQYELWPFLRKVVVVPLGSCLFAGVVIALCNNFIDAKISRLTGLAILLFEAAVFGALYVAAILKYNYLDRFDWETIASQIGIVRNR